MSEEKKGFATKEVTRRQFLKISGVSLTGLVLSTPLLTLMGCTQKQVDDGSVTTWAFPQGQQGQVHRLPALRDQLHSGQRRMRVQLHLPGQGDPQPVLRTQ